MSEKIPVLMDCDPGLDDAVAIGVLAGSKAVDLLGVVTVAGNQNLETVTKNARAVLDFLGLSRVPVVAGAERPLFRAAGAVTEDTDALDLPAGAEQGEILRENPISFYESVLEQADRPVTILATGPLTNLAVLVKAYPAAAEKIKKIVVMGGANLSTDRKNFETYTRTAGYNFCWDAEAAHMVFAAGIPVEMVGADLTYPNGLTLEEISSMEGTATGDVFAAMCRKIAPHYKALGYEMCPVQDGLAAVYLLRPGLFTIQRRDITVDYTGTYTYGASYVDLRHKSEPQLTTWWVSDCRRREAAAYLAACCRG